MSTIDFKLDILRNALKGAGYFNDMPESFLENAAKQMLVTLGDDPYVEYELDDIGLRILVDDDGVCLRHCLAWIEIGACRFDLIQITLARMSSRIAEAKRIERPNTK